MSDNDGDYMEKAKVEIARWEATEPGFIAHIGEAILWPAQKAAEYLVPEAVQDAVAKTIEGFLGGLDFATRYTIDAEEIESRLAELQSTLKDELKSADEAAKHYWNWHVGYAAAEGGLAGATGLMGLAADIPALFAIALRLIQQVGTCFGMLAPCDSRSATKNSARCSSLRMVGRPPSCSRYALRRAPTI